MEGDCQGRQDQSPYKVKTETEILLSHDFCPPEIHVYTGVWLVTLLEPPT